MHKTIFVYFSYSGGNDRIAKHLQDEFGCDILKLETETTYSPTSLKAMFAVGMESVRKISPALKPYTFDPAKYDNIIIGTPVWAWTFSPALRSFTDNTKIVGKNVLLTCTHGGKPGKTIEKLVELFVGNNVLFKKEIKVPITSDIIEKLSLEITEVLK